MLKEVKEKMKIKLNELMVVEIEAENMTLEQLKRVVELLDEHNDNVEDLLEEVNVEGYYCSNCGFDVDKYDLYCPECNGRFVEKVYED